MVKLVRQYLAILSRDLTEIVLLIWLPVDLYLVPY